MKSFRKPFFASPAARALAIAAVSVCAWSAAAELPPWMREAISGSAIEAALYQWMDLPGGRTLYPRPPADAVRELKKLSTKDSASAELSMLRAQSQEQSLDFNAAEASWKQYVAHAPDQVSARLQLADFYNRRLRPADEVRTLMEAGALPANASEKYTPASKQQSWLAFERILRVASDQSLPDDVTLAAYRAWVARYPGDTTVRARQVQYLLSRKQLAAAEAAVADYLRVFPNDIVHAVRFTAEIEQQRGSADAALHVYDAAYQPLWPAELVQLYFALLHTTHRERAWLAESRAQLQKNPDDLRSATRIFYYLQQQRRLQEAADTFTAYAQSKQQRKAAWTADELYTFATLLESVHFYTDAARFYFALHSATGAITGTQQAPEEIALSGLTRILLTVPEQPVALGAGNLAIYRDIATVDDGPGYWNGILSLWLNSSSPQYELDAEEQKAKPYFHRAKAAELLKVLDAKYPSSPSRPSLHLALLRAYAEYGQNEAVLKSGEQFLAQFPSANERMAVASAMADAYAQTNNTQGEFAMYDRMLAELSEHAGRMPLTEDALSNTATNAAPPKPAVDTSTATTTEDTADDAPPPPPEAADAPPAPPAPAPSGITYAQVLERYLGRLTTSNKLPQALAVFRRELDRNPDDPLLYERLAAFLQQNNLASQQEEVYKAALSRFKDESWYSKLARFYIRQQQRDAFQNITRQVVDTFRGTELTTYFQQAITSWPEVSLQVNLYAHQRFPHELQFTRNLLNQYESERTRNKPEWEKLMRQHWFEADDLRSRFFEHLSSTGTLDSEVASLEKLAGASAKSNPAAAHELAEAQLWRSHFEEGAPLLGALADLYPADETLGSQATGVYRSLAYFDPSATDRAIAIQKRLHLFAPGNADRITTLGDIYGDRAQRDDDPAPALARAAEWFRKIPAPHPGVQKGYLDSATVFWDYFQFDDALAQIAFARQRFGNPALFGYEAGAIYEGKRQCGLAVAEYVKAAVADTETHAAQNRLLQLANRKGCGDEVNAQTAKLVQASPSLSALRLRVDVLNAQNNKAPSAKTQVAALLDSAILSAKSEDDAAHLAEYAQSSGMRPQYRHALQRQADLAIDPVTKMEVRYTLANALLADNDYPAAQAVISSVYHDNPKILGVVRRTSDFYWNNKHPKEAVATLVQAAQDATADLSPTLLLEASSKAAQSGDAAEARRIANDLLARYPNDARYIHAVAESYATSHDDSGLRDFYAAQIASASAAPLTRDERRDRIATLRRGMIPALVSLKDYAGATSQYIELLNAYPEDPEITSEVARFALRYGREQQLIDHLDRTVAASPRDSRFTIMLARVQTVFGNIPQAIAAYQKTIAIRKDRIDVYTSKAELEDRTQRFDEAASDYERLYLLSYHSPEWKVKQAEARARQGKTELVVSGLKTAWIEGKPTNAANQFRVAEQLESWNMLAEAEQFAREGARLAGDDLLVQPDFASGAKTYARILMRERKAADAMSLLKEARKQANISPSSPTAIVQQVQKEGILSVTDAEWRRRLVQQRHEQAETAFASCLTAMGTTVATFYTPEEKLAYAQLLDTERANQPSRDVEAIWIPAASSAMLFDREADWRKSLLLAANKSAAAQLQSLTTLQHRRMQNAELAAAVEAYAATLPAAKRSAVLAAAQEAWKLDGNGAEEMRVLGAMHLADDSLQSLRERYFALLLRKAPDRMFAQLAGRASAYSQSAGNFILANGTATQALRAVNTLGTSRGPLWTSASTALTGLYFVAQLNPTQRTATDTAFANALDTRTIGERLLGKDKDSVPHITGDEWFRYGMRYGAFRAAANAGDAEDFLPAGLEHAPDTAQSYVFLADEYENAGRLPEAVTEYTHALELAPQSASTERKLARVLWLSGHQAEAVAHWQRSAHILRGLVDLVAVPESFWTDFAALNVDVRQYHPQPAVEAAIDNVLRSYIAKNGNYRSAELLRSRYAGPHFDEAEMQRLFAMAQAARYPSGVVAALDEEPWIPESLRGAFLQRQLQLLVQARATSQQGEDWYLAQTQRRLMDYLLRHDRFDEAERLFNSVSEAKRTSDFRTAAVRIAIHKGTLDQLLATYAAQTPTDDQLKELSQIASELKDAQRPAKRTLLEFVYEQHRAANTLNAPDILALADVELDMNDTASAIQLLRSLTLLPGDAYANFDSAAKLLEEKKKFPEAVPFLQVLAGNTPWNAAFRVRLAQAELAAGGDKTAPAAELARIASDSSATYTQRLDAATTLGQSHLGNTVQGSAELQLLARGTPPTAEEASKPYFVAARVEAANAITQPAGRISLLRAAIAIDPQDDGLRLKLFQSEYAAGEFSRALAAIDPLLNNSYPSVSYAQPAEPESSSEEEDTEAATSNSASVYAPIPAQLTTAQQRREFAQQMSVLHEKLGDLQEALLYARAASADGEPAQPGHRVEQLMQRISLEQSNARRRPRLGDGLHQAVIVRPRLTASRKEQTP